MWGICVFSLASFSLLLHHGWHHWHGMWSWRAFSVSCGSLKAERTAVCVEQFTKWIWDVRYPSSRDTEYLALMRDYLIELN